MDCQQNSGNSTADKLEVFNERRSSNHTTEAWLVRQGVLYLNSADQQAELAYKHIIGLLSRNNAADTLVQLTRETANTDTTLRWSLLYMLGDLADQKTAQWLAQFSTAPLPPRGEACEGPRDGELLLRTMAIESLKKVAARYPETSEYLLKIIAEHPDREVLIEAVKAAVDLGLKDKVTEILSEKDRWILDIRKAKAAELHADPERSDSGERSFTPPKMRADYNTPSTGCGCTKGGTNHG